MSNLKESVSGRLQGDRVVASASSIQSSVSKLIEIIDEENDLLRQHRISSHASFVDRKNHALRELIAAQHTESLEASARTCRLLFERLSSALRLNAKLLKLHISAVGEVSDIIVGCMRESDSDGTYGRCGMSKRR
ncbi:hypothetical protein [Aestuariivirga sp.]|uniref:hypothetical protein n=1 Tax=Aestuariivirga sp. TaxID=2650926 RepID=UPI0035935708